MGKLLPAMTQQKLDTQREVVMNERRWTMDNQPYGTWMEKLPALCFPPEHPFHHSLIGSMEDLAAASLDDVAQFFATYYTPDNAVLSIAGDFEPADARALDRTTLRRHSARRGQAAAARHVAAAGVRPVEARGRRRTTIMLPRLFLAFRSPAFGTDEYYAASVCGAVLGLRNGSRLRRRLGARAAGCRGSDRVHVRSRERQRPARRRRHGASGHSRRAARAGGGARDRRRCVRDGVDAAEVERAVALIQTSFVSAMQQAGERADRLSMFATYFGNPELINEEVERYQAVTVDARQRIRARTARREQSRESALRAARRRARRAGRRRRGGGGAMSAPAAAKAARPTPGPAARIPVSAFRAPPTRERTRARRRAGHEAAARDRGGAGRRGRRLRSAGTRRHGAARRRSCCSRARRRATAPSSPSASSDSARRSTREADWDAAAITMTALAEHLPDGVRSARRGDSNAGVPCARSRAAQGRAHRRAACSFAPSRAGSPTSCSRDSLYAPSSRYARPEGGDERSVDAIEREQSRRVLRDRDICRAARRVIVAGDITADRAEELVASRVRRLEGRHASRAIVGDDLPARHAARGAHRREERRAAVGAAHRPRRHSAQSSGFLSGQRDERGAGRTVQLAHQPESPRGARVHVRRVLGVRLAAAGRTVRRIDGGEIRHHGRGRARES